MPCPYKRNRKGSINQAALASAEAWTTFICDIANWPAPNPLNNIIAPNVAQDGTISLVNLNVASPQNYKNVWRLALGANYKMNDTMMLRVGGGYDETPTNDIDRDMRLPDASRWALAIGGHYQARPNLGLDLGYTHLFAVKNPTINRTDALNAVSSYNVNAVAKANADLIGAQLTWLMDQGKHQG